MFTKEELVRLKTLVAQEIKRRIATIKALNVTVLQSSPKLGEIPSRSGG